MAVPNTTNFTLQDVIDELPNSQDDLLECFAESNDASFDSAYKGSKNQLLNFRNYDHFRGFGTKQQTVGYSTSSASSACNATQFVFFIEYGKTWANTTKIWSNFEATVFAPSRWYSDGTRARYWNGSSFTSTSFC
ncbi:hypothetical protein [Flagellimonas onchidii]|uniref:hypothetical protein n=1 Tax=Flagellimonas onchidii TaxID=2562684 RepID=UPI0010A5E0DF|nr:hypothetical protein [Allomuricauda onchidii]